jgi:UDP-N-acetyl-D-glucosamine dehydrogenase
MLELLEARGLDVAYHDPLIPTLGQGARELASVALGPEALAAADCVVIHTDHDAFDYRAIVEPARLVFDTRNATRDVRSDRSLVVRL